MSNIKQLGPAQCILLAVSLASDASLQALQALTTQRHDVFQLELTLRILVSYLPESVEPALYVPFLAQLATGEHATAASVFPVDSSSLKDTSDEDAADRLRKLRLLKLHDSQERRTAVQDPLVLFLIHRSLRIDAETGLLQLVPQLVTPFLDRSAYLHEWFISTVLPLLRLDYEYYPQPSKWTALREFEHLDGLNGIDTLLTKAVQASAQPESDADLEADEAISRDLRGLVGPWVYGSSQRKRRRIAAASSSSGPQDTTAAIEDWQNTFQWIVNIAATNFEAAATAIEHWDGPTDVDLGGYDDIPQAQDDSIAELQYHLRSRYCQAGFASIYASEIDSVTGLEGVHRVLVRLADMCGFASPPDAATPVELLPPAERIAMPLEEIPKDFLHFDSFLRPDQPLTTPTPDSYSLLQQLVTTSRLLGSIGHSLSICKAAKMRFWSDESEQLRLLQKIINGLRHGESKTEQDYIHIRRTLLWLWSWGVEDDSMQGYGILGKTKKAEIEKEMLKALCSASQYRLAVNKYLPAGILTEAEVEAAVVSTVLQYYDNASNGNRTRGGMKKASEVHAAFRQPLPSSTLLRRLGCLLSATHALSFYALTLQQGVPLQPVSIRTQPDSISLLQHVLEQNPGAYTKLDDLVQIGCNLVIALDHDPSFEHSASVDPADEAARAKVAERRVIGMAIEAALREEDFETAYSYVVNRLPSPQTALASGPGDGQDEDDMSWRAAFAAGRHRTSPSSTANPSGTSTTTSPTVRRLEQRMELLSTALLLAPPPALPEVLAAWRRCEEELLTVLATESAEEAAFDDGADKGEVRIPGEFAAQEPTFMVQPRRKEIGRGTVEEAPMGLFDVARGAAQAFGRSAGMARGGRQSGPTEQGHGRTVSGAFSEDGDGRQRKRDVVANAVTGGLVSGIGWVLGAKPVGEERDGER
ncbi:hypothetical protein FH972_022785 [Carpinus fangiana]|uniref:Sec39 domain-containing protein n=1 Tax=Carpinus fangiana TaxID=176857 RepID=A0A5N6KTR5_9ROSI|nr:hypothetical protein FH972_022785 [Carpinus fangiana]